MDIIVIGGINIDIEGSPFAALLDRDSNPGTVSIAYGGVGRNIAENLARLGQSVGMVSVVGNDELGRGAKEHLAGLGADTSMIRTIEGAGSCIYLSILDENMDMKLAVNDMEIIKEITPEYIRENLAEISKAKAIALDANLDEAALEEITAMLTGANEPAETGEPCGLGRTGKPDDLDAAGKSNCPKLFLDPVSASKAPRTISSIGRFHSIKPNLIETEAITGLTIESQADLTAAADWFIDRGVENVYITLGKEGVYYKNREKDGCIHPKKDIKLVSATGAGDAFSAMVLTGMAEDLDIEEIARLGMAASELAMESKKAVNEKIDIDEIKRRIL